MKLNLRICMQSHVLPLKHALNKKYHFWAVELNVVEEAEHLAQIFGWESLLNMLWYNDLGPPAPSRELKRVYV